MADSIQIQGFGGIFIYAEDAATLVAWYARVLGIQLEPYGKSWFVEWPSAHRLPGSSRIATVHFAIFQADGPMPTARTARIALRVDDLAQACAAIEALGEVVRQKPEMNGYGRFAWVDDPEGNSVELWEPPRA